MEQLLSIEDQQHLQKQHDLLLAAVNKFFLSEEEFMRYRHEPQKKRMQNNKSRLKQLAKDMNKQKKSKQQSIFSK